MSRLRPILLGASAAAGLIALSAAPALAQAAAAGGFAAAVDGWLAPTLGTLATGAVGWAVVRYHKLTGVQMSASMTADVRETAATGLHLAAHELGVELDRSLPQAKRDKLVAQGVSWVMDRLPGPLAALRLGKPVVTGIVVKMLDQIIKSGGAAPAGIAASAGPGGLALPGLLPGDVEKLATAGLAQLGRTLGQPQPKG